MSKRKIVVVLFLVAVATGAMAFNRPAPVALNRQAQALNNYQAAPQNNTSNPQTYNSIPIHIVYGLLFRENVAFKQKAQEKAAKGEDGSALLNYHQHEAELNNEQAETFDIIAADCEREVALLDARAKQIIDQDRKLHPGGKINEGENLPAPPAELRTLEDRRTATIIQARERLREALGEEEFQRFDELMRRNMANKIKPLLPINFSQPSPSAQ